jgi:bacillithiol biosynthesis cysteine-adding enzyme BshC
VILDPSHPTVKKAASSILLQAVRRWEVANDAILGASESLREMGYAPQIEARKERLPLFITRGGERLSLSYENGGFRDSAGGRVTPAELEALARGEPQALSPNVSLRPIVQDFLFHTSAYVAGPGEIAYFAQIAPLYDVFGIDMPVIFPRGLYTLVEPVAARAMEKLGAGVGVFGGVEKDLEEVFIRQAGGLRGLEVLNRTKSDIERLVDRLQVELTSIEPDISGPFETYRKKTSYQLRKLEGKLKAASDRRHAAVLRQARLARSHLFPLGRPQERVLNTCYCMAHFGEEFVSRLLPDLNPFDFQHKAVWL